MLATLLIRRTTPFGFRSTARLQVRGLSTEAAIPIQLVKELRARTKAGVLECKNALLATGGDLDRAVEWLTAQAKKTADKKSARITAEGAVFVAVHKGLETGGADVAGLLELNSETDFVAKTPDFLATGQKMLTALLTSADHTASGQLDVAQLLDVTRLGPEQQTGREWISNLVGVTKENCQLRRATLMRTARTADTLEVLGCYIHSTFDNAAASAAELRQQHPSLEIGAGQSGAMVRLHVRGPATPHLAELRALARALSTHIVGLKPRGISASLAAPSQPASGDDEAEPLLAQSYLFDDSVTVQQLLAQRARAWGLELAVHDYAYWLCGEGIERKSESLRDEVAKLLH